MEEPQQISDLILPFRSTFESTVQPQGEVLGHSFSGMGPRMSRRGTVGSLAGCNTIPLPSPGPASAKPTPEEVQGWAQSFDKLMKSPAGRNVFREFLRTEYSEENMLFWLACEELKTECNKHTIDEKARTIYEDYISILSPKEVGGRAFEGRVLRERALFQLPPEPCDSLGRSLAG